MALQAILTRTACFFMVTIWAMHQAQETGNIYRKRDNYFPLAKTAG